MRLGIEAIRSPKQQRRPLHFFLYESFLSSVCSTVYPLIRQILDSKMKYFLVLQIQFIFLWQKTKIIKQLRILPNLYGKNFFIHLMTISPYMLKYIFYCLNLTKSLKHCCTNLLKSIILVKCQNKKKIPKSRSNHLTLIRICHTCFSTVIMFRVHID